MYLKKTQQTHLQKQWRFLSNQLRKLTEQGKFQQLADAKKAYLLGKLKSLFQKMLRFEKASSLKNALGGAALLLGMLATPLQAQVNFAPEVNDPFGLVHSGEVAFNTFVDLDGDGDLDLISVRYDYDGANDGQVFEFTENVSTNEGTVPSFIEPIIDYLDVQLPNAAVTDYTNVTFGDLDNDGDLDMIITEYDDDSGANAIYYENVGDANNPAFAEPMSNPFGIDFGPAYTAVPHLKDIDSDGDLDLIGLTATYDYATEEDIINYSFIENIGSPENPSFGEIQASPFGLPVDFSKFPYTDIGDIDNDGDFDIIASGILDFDTYAVPPFTFFENIGTVSEPQFGEPAINPFGLETINEISIFVWPHFGDIDNDGDLDILTDAAYDYDTYTAKWTFHENLLDPVATKEPTLVAQVSVFPTVSNNFVTLVVEAEKTQDYFQVNVFDVQGELLTHKELAGGSVLNERIDLSAYPAGQYLIQVRTPEGMLVEKVVKQ